jgi:SEC-C motif-containing protein
LWPLSFWKEKSPNGRSPYEVSICSLRLKEEAQKWANSSEWKGLEIKKTQKGQGEDATGVVEFVAHYQDKASGTELRHHETSLFQKKDGAWFFKEGHIHGAQPVKRLEPKLGRNDVCSCGSGKKFKKCCGK